MVFGSALQWETSSSTEITQWFAHQALAAARDERLWQYKITSYSSFSLASKSGTRICRTCRAAWILVQDLKESSTVTALAGCLGLTGVGSCNTWTYYRNARVSWLQDSHNEIVGQTSACACMSSIILSASDDHQAIASLQKKLGSAFPKLFHQKLSVLSPEVFHLLQSKILELKTCTCAGLSIWFQIQNLICEPGLTFEDTHLEFAKLI